MRGKFVGFSIFVGVAVGVAVGVYFASQISDGSTSAQQVEQSPTPLSTPLPTAAPTSTVEPAPEQDEPALIPTAPPPISLTPEPAPTPTPTTQPGVCPKPYRQVATVAEILGGRIEGGTSYQQGYLTLHFPAGREFLISSGVGGEGLSLTIYDIQTQSVLSIRGDGCELGRTIGDAAADAVFDEIVASLEVGSSYVCPSRQRSLLAPDEIPPDPSLLGQRVTGGAPEAAQLGLYLPSGREFVVWHGIADPGGGFTGIYDIAARSYLFLGADGCEWSRQITDSAADAVFDEIVRAQDVPLQ